MSLVSLFSESRSAAGMTADSGVAPGASPHPHPWALVLVLCCPVPLRPLEPGLPSPGQSAGWGTSPGGGVPLLPHSLLLHSETFNWASGRPARGLLPAFLEDRRGRVVQFPRRRGAPSLTLAEKEPGCPWDCRSAFPVSRNRPHASTTQSNSLAGGWGGCARARGSTRGPAAAGRTTLSCPLGQALASFCKGPDSK